MRCVATDNATEADTFESYLEQSDLISKGNEGGVARSCSVLTIVQQHYKIPECTLSNGSLSLCECFKACASHQ